MQCADEGDGRVCAYLLCCVMNILKKLNCIDFMWQRCRSMSIDLIRGKCR